MTHQLQELLTLPATFEIFSITGTPTVESNNAAERFISQITQLKLLLVLLLADGKAYFEL